MFEVRDAETAALPFLRWIGGKRWLSKRIVPAFSELLDLTGGRYHEPFMGSSAIYFALSPRYASLSDVNGELVETFRAVQTDWASLVDILKGWEPTKFVYDRIRKLQPATTTEAAARFLYLNRTCYGGIHRTNRKGEFNTPFGGGDRNAAILWERDVLRRASAVLARDTTLSVKDFEEAMDDAVFGDLVFCDPPYADPGRTQFDRYGARIFSWEDQERLARACDRASRRGVNVVVTNGPFVELTGLYPSALHMTVQRHKSIGTPNTHRRASEFVFATGPDVSRVDWSALDETVPTPLFAEAA